ncbi:MAG: hypothetical protein HFE90_08575 [Firmicutes bacterium]|nr:hypothetical protein [Bacillota bacterium]
MKKVILYWVLSAAVIIAGAQVIMIASEHYRQAFQKFYDINLIETAIVNCLPLIIYLLTALFCAGICGVKLNRGQNPAALIVMAIISVFIILASIVQTVMFISDEIGIAVLDVRYKNFAYLFVFPLVSLIKVWISGRRD